MRRPASNIATAIPLLTLLLASVWLVGAPVVAGDDDESHRKLRYERGPTRRPDLPARNEHAAIPDALKRASHDSHGTERTRSGNDRDRDRNDGDRSADRHEEHGHDHPGEPTGSLRRGIVDDARQAGRHAAERRVERRGEAQYYRVGFYEGQRLAFDDPHLGRWDTREGERWAYRDRDARAEGRAQGEQAALAFARTTAADRVTTQFHELSREPRYAPETVVPGYDPVEPDLPAVTLRAVFADFPLRSATVSIVGRGYLDGWDYEGFRLYGCSSYSALYDDAWSDSRRAFARWVDRGASRLYRKLQHDEERQLYRQQFRRAFDRRIAQLYRHHLEVAYEHGLDDGWAYGATIQRELAYRQGYRRGYVAAVVDASRESFARVYPEAYERAYAESFDDWAHNAKPAIGELWLDDANDDGVFEPGERVEVELELFNYGGAAGHFPVRLAGRGFYASRSTEVTVAARSVRRFGPFEATIVSTARPRSSTDLAVNVGGLEARVPVRVDYPLAIAHRRLVTDRDNLSGEVRLSVAVRNISRRAHDGTVLVASRARGAYPLERPLGVLPAGGEAEVTLVVDGLDPLDMIGGNVGFDIEARRGGVVNDRYDLRLPEVAGDLANRDLIDYLLWMGRSARPTAAEITRGRELILQRLRADWRAAVRGSGNPYKRDLKRGEGGTALGDLVRTLDAERHTITQPAVFAGLSRDVVALSRDLPGIHPFLRKSMRRLARHLP